MVDKKKLYSVSELAHEFDLTAQALRFYENKGLLSPARSGNARVYTYRDRARLLLILKFRRVGFSLDDIHEYLQLYGTGNGGHKQYQLGLEKIRRRRDELQKMKREIDEISAELEEMENDALDKRKSSRARSRARFTAPPMAKPGPGRRSWPMPWPGWGWSRVTASAPWPGTAFAISRSITPCRARGWSATPSIWTGAPSSALA
jgi:DNA-binding transcriptional MerR regulator